MAKYFFEFYSPKPKVPPPSPCGKEEIFCLNVANAAQVKFPPASGGGVVLLNCGAALTSLCGGSRALQG